MFLDKLDHFLSFISISRVIQDMPFGEKTLKLSSTEIKIHNVIRTCITDQIVKQYQSYCLESGFNSPLSRTVLFRILKMFVLRPFAPHFKVWTTSHYFSEEGSKSFDDLEEIVDKLGDVFKLQLGLSWSKEQTRKLKLAKRYLKGDYKVSDISLNLVIS